MKKILALSGSPRRGGNSETLLDRAVSGLETGGGEVEKIILNELKITPCQECGGCDKTGICTVNDDMRIIYPKLDQAHIIILAAPIFFSGISAQAKALIDRCQCHWIRKFILEQSPHRHKRSGAFISVRGQAGLGVFQFAAKPVRAMFVTEDINCSQELFVDEVDAKGDVNKRKDVLNAAYRLGRNLLGNVNLNYTEE